MDVNAVTSSLKNNGATTYITSAYKEATADVALTKY
jgi:hypothetical protein